MKKIILLICVQILAINVCSAQMAEFPYLNSNQVIGIYNLDNEVAALSFAETRNYDKKDIYLLSFLNDNKTQSQFAVNQGSYLVGTSSSNSQTYFVFNDQFGNGEIIHVADDYTLSFANYESRDGDFSTGRPAMIETNQAGNLFIFSNYSIAGKDDKGRDITIERGIEIKGYDHSLNEIGAYRYKDLSRVTSFTPIAEGFVLNIETLNKKEKQFDLELVIFNNNLEMLGKHNLTGGESYFPSDIISHNNQIIVAGYNLKGSIFEAKATEGLFTRVISMDGTELSTNKFSWLTLKEKLANGEKGDFIFNGKKDILIQKIIPSASGYKIVCESYSNHGGTTAAEFLLGDNNQNRVITVYDFVIFETSPSGELTSVNILNKEHMNIEVGGGKMSKASRIEYAYHLKRYQAFPFRSVRDNKISFVNYKNKVGYLSEMDMVSGEITQGLPILLEPVIEEEVNEQADEMVANSKMLTKLDNMDKKLNNTSEKLDKVGSKLEYGIEKVDLIFNPWQKNDHGIYTLANGQTIAYLIHPERHSVYFEVLNK